MDEIIEWVRLYKKYSGKTPTMTNSIAHAAGIDLAHVPGITSIFPEGEGLAVAFSDGVQINISRWELNNSQFAICFPPEGANSLSRVMYGLSGEQVVEKINAMAAAAAAHSK